MAVRVSRSSVISSKGQVTVPVEIRARLGLKEGDRVEFVLDGKRTILRPVHSTDNPFVKYVGALPAFSGVKEINAWVKSLRDEQSRTR
ncbi:MAG: AbrB/MazE/SpoVT family DNA-binding domain-containing protein [Acidobacteriaceae bacterium]|nr:AbrB/MazE/SpoVT family DNA-binding domain-containing protein [Acidobacteriaceae bacterium]